MLKTQTKQKQNISKSPNSGYNTKMANQFLALGLFIMLLSFFIVLNSMSNFAEEKSQAVIESLSEAFFAQPPMQKEMESQVVTAPAESLRSGDTLDNIKALFQATIPDSKAQKNRLGTIMTVTVPRDAFETALENVNLPVDANSESTGFNSRFADMLAALLDTKVSMPYEMDILLLTQENPSTLRRLQPANANTLIKKAASYSALLQDRGLETKLVSSGLQQGEAGKVALIFTQYKPISLEVIR